MNFFKTEALLSCFPLSLIIIVINNINYHAQFVPITYTFKVHYPPRPSNFNTTCHRVQNKKNTKGKTTEIITLTGNIAYNQSKAKRQTKEQVVG